MLIFGQSAECEPQLSLLVVIKAARNHSVWRRFGFDKPGYPVEAHPIPAFSSRQMICPQRCIHTWPILTSNRATENRPSLAFRLLQR